MKSIYLKPVYNKMKCIYVIENPIKNALNIHTLQCNISAIRHVNESLQDNQITKIKKSTKNQK